MTHREAAEMLLLKTAEAMADLEKIRAEAVPDRWSPQRVMETAWMIEQSIAVAQVHATLAVTEEP